MRLDELTVKQLLESIAAKTPTPGGGAVAAITAALSAAIAQMVVNYSIGKKSLLQHDEQLRDALAQLQKTAAHAMNLAAADARAYAALNDVWKLDKSDPRREKELSAAVDAAIHPPGEMLRIAIEMLELLHSLQGRTNANLNSDFAIASILAEAAARSAAWNVMVNLSSISDQNRREELAGVVKQQLRQASELASQVETAIQAGQ